MRKLARFSLFTLLFVRLFSAPIAVAEALDQVCEYDKFCKRAVDTHGQTLPIKPLVQVFIEDNRDNILEQAAKMHVDPRAVAGSIAAENTMNVHIDDDIQDWAAQVGVTENVFTGKQFTVGPGQIKLDSAMEAESHIAAIEGRPVRSKDDVRRELLTANGAIYYATAIVRQGQDDYKAKGIDISNNPALLGTLYNLGKTEERANTAANTKTKPRENYFGYFIGKNQKEIENLIGWSPEKGRFKPSRASQIIDGPMFTRGDLKMVTSPSRCQHGGNGDFEEIKQIETERQFSTAGYAGGAFKVIGHNIDCDMKPYYLVEMANGHQGWVKGSELTEPGMVEPYPDYTSTCDSRGATQCVADLTSKYPELRKEGTASVEKPTFDPGNLNLKAAVLSRDDTPVASIKKFNADACAQQQSNLGFNMAGNPISSAKVKAMAAKLDSIKKILAGRLEIDPANFDHSPNNPFGPSFPKVNVETLNCLHQMPGHKNPNPITCETDMSDADINNFLKKDFSSMNTKDLISALPARIGISDSDRTRRGLSKTQIGLIVDDSKKRVEEACRDQMKEYDLQGGLNEMVKAMKDFDPVANPGVYGSGSRKGIEMYFDGIISYCNVIHQSDLKQRGLSYDNSVKCSLRVGQVGINLGADAWSKLGITEADVKTAMHSSLKQGTSVFTGGNRGFTGKADCTYDQLATAKLVSRLSGESCVDQIHVPDPFILQALKGEKQKVLYVPDTENSFSIRLRGKCGIRTGAEQPSAK